MISTTDVFQRLEGTWHFRRDITGTQPASAVGTATFTKTAPDALRYHEQGKLNTHDFYQDYVYQLQDDAIQVCFSNGIPYLTLVRGHGQPLCGQDQYGLEYRLEPDSENTFRIVCTARGPTQFYTITTDYSAS